MSRKRKRIIVAVAALVVVAAVVGYRWVTTRRVAGTYITEGGLGCIVIARNGVTGSRIEKDFVYPTLKCGVRSLGSWLTMNYIPQTGLSGTHYLLGLKRSRSRPGDWDLVSYTEVLPPGFGVSSGFFAWLEGATGIALRRPVRIELPVTAPIPYLHRIEDRRVVEHFERLRTQKDAKAAYETAGSLLRDYPDDLYVRALYLNAAEQVGDLEEVARRMKTWKQDFEKSGDAFLKWTARRMSVAGRNAARLVWQVLGSETDLATQLTRFPEMLEMEGFIYPRPPGLGTPASGRFLELQVASKVFRVIAVFRMLEGKRTDALRLLAANYHLGQLMSENTTLLIERLIGTAIKGISVWCLQIYVLNCCETEAECKEAWEMLERLAKAEDRRARGASLVVEYPFDLDQMKTARPNVVEVRTRMDHASGRFGLLRMAAAARYHFVTRGEFPTTDTAFAPWLPNGLPADPFGKGPLRLLPRTDELICYSVGPDKRDDRATIEYDPTNGTISRGDITLRMPREREFPFPRQGVRATSADDLRRQFPNGLPPDPFATNRGRGLSVAESADGQVYLWSFGPDVDEYKSLNPLSFCPVPTTGTFLFPSEIPAAYKPPSAHRLQVPYDPTNGTVSEGDLFIPIPRR